MRKKLPKMTVDKNEVLEMDALKGVVGRVSPRAEMRLRT